MRNDCLARRTSTDATAPATGLIISNQRLGDIERTAFLNKDTTATPVATAVVVAARHGLVVGDVNPV